MTSAATTMFPPQQQGASRIHDGDAPEAARWCIAGRSNMSRDELAEGARSVLTERRPSPDAHHGGDDEPHDEDRDRGADDPFGSAAAAALKEFAARRERR